MTNQACRDCGNQLAPNARGCPRCAMNIEAERMIERFIWLWFVPGVFVIALITAVGIVWWLR